MNCPQCGSDVPTDALECPNCHALPLYPEDMPPPANQQDYNPALVMNGMAIASSVLSLASIVCIFSRYGDPAIWIGLTIVSLVLGIISLDPIKKYPARSKVIGFAIAGIALALLLLAAIILPGL